jgi:hypothetical protein
LSLNGQSIDKSKAQNNKSKTKLKGGLTLVYDPDGEGPGEMSMEEMRATLPQYLKFLRLTVES